MPGSLAEIRLLRLVYQDDNATDLQPWRCRARTLQISKRNANTNFFDRASPSHTEKNWYAPDFPWFSRQLKVAVASNGAFQVRLQSPGFYQGKTCFSSERIARFVPVYGTEGYWFESSRVY